MFQPSYGHFEYNVTCFKFINAPTIFQHLVNDIFQENLDDFVVACLKFILIISQNPMNRQWHVCLVFQKIHDT
jgi:hypothetical protein